MSSERNRIACSGAHTLLAAVFTAAVGLAACSGNTVPDSDGKATADDNNGKRAQPIGQMAAGMLTAFRLIRTPRSQSDLARAGSDLATILRGRPLPATKVQAALATVGGDPEALDVAIETSGLQFSYRADNDRRLVIDEAVTNSMAMSDIGKVAAHAVFTSAFQSAIGSGLIAANGLNGGDVRNSSIVRGEGVAGQAPVEWISEYIFTVPRSINGIEVFDAGFEVSVHRTGQLARVQMFGPRVVSTTSSAGTEISDASGYSFSRSVSPADLDSRVAAEYPGSDVRAIGMRYWLPPGVADAVIEPTQMYFVVPIAVIDGQTVKARGFYIAYSVKDMKQTATIWPRAEVHPSGDGRK